MPFVQKDGNYNTATDTILNDVHKYDKDSHLLLHIFKSSWMCGGIALDLIIIIESFG